MSVTFPHQVEQWSGVKGQLTAILNNPPYSGNELEDRLIPILKETQPGVDTTVFAGLKDYLKDTHWQKRERFFSKALPTIVQYALDIEKHAPQDVIRIAQQGSDTRLVIPRPLSASMLACGFLCLWPISTPTTRHINFLRYFKHCNTDLGQGAKLECILHYFECLADEGEPAGNVIFYRQVLQRPEVWTLSEWEASDTPLCPLEVHVTGRIEDAGPQVLQVDFANKKLGGAVLGNSKAQEEIRFSLCPELITGIPFMETMTEHEAIVMQGFRNYSEYKGYSRAFRHAGAFNDTAQTDSRGNLENFLVAIDALNLRDGRLKPERQYESQLLLRELNKASIGFRQDFLADSDDPLQGEYTPSEGRKESGDMRGVVETYFSSLSESILTRALQESLVSLKDEVTQSSPATSAHSSATSAHSPATSAHSPATSSHSSGQNGRTHPVSETELIGATLEFARRRSSNLSDVSSRRSSCTTGSRRSSGNQLTSSECSELEEYFQAYQARHSLKPSVIKEEIGDTSEAATSEVHQLADHVMQSIFNPSVLAQETGPKEPEVKTFSKEQPNVPIVRPKARILTQKSPDSVRKKSPGRQKSDLSQAKSDLSHTKSHRSSIHRGDGRTIDFADSKHDSSLSAPEVGFQESTVHKKESRVEFKPSHLTFRPPRAPKLSQKESNSPQKSTSSENPIENLEVVNNNMTESPRVPDHLYSYAGYLADSILDESWREVYELFVGERYRSDSYSSGKHSEKGQVEGFIGGIVENVWNYSAYNVRKHYKSRQEQQMWTSDSDIDLDLDLYIYADDFVQGVISDAVGAYKSQKKEELKKVEAMWQRAQEKFETDAKYFNAEFSRYWEEVHSRQSRVYQRSRIQWEMQRRRSLDETGRNYRQRHHQNHHNFRDGSLSNFEHQLLKSAGQDKLFQESMSSFEQELLNVGGVSSSGGLGNDFSWFPALRRASEPVNTRRTSFDLTHLYPMDRGRRGSSVGSASSREMILDWLNESQRSSSSSGTSKSRRIRTTSSHLDWYAQDLLLEAFNDALKEIFGDLHSTGSVVHRVVTGAGVESDNSFSSSQSNNDLICDTYIAIPNPPPQQTSSQINIPSANFSSSNSSGVNSVNQTSLRASKPSISARSQQPLNEESVQMFPSEGGIHLSSSPIEFSQTIPKTTQWESSERLKGTRHSLSDRNVGLIQPRRTLSPNSHQIEAAMSLHTSSQESKSNESQGASSQSVVRTIIPDSQPTDQSGALLQTDSGSHGMSPGPSLAETRLVGRLAEQMMTGMCENLSNEVLEGAVSRLHAQQPQQPQRGDVTAARTAAKVTSTGAKIKSTAHSMLLPVATGNWGCGAFRGDAQLKALIQWAAASERNVPRVLYYTFGDNNVDKLEGVVTLIRQRGMTVGELTSLLLKYCEQRNSQPDVTLFEFIEQSL